MTHDQPATAHKPTLPVTLAGWIRTLLNSKRSRDFVSFQASMLVHCLLLVILGLVLVQPASQTQPPSLLVAPPAPEESDNELVELAIDPVGEAEEADHYNLLPDEAPATLEPLDLPSPIRNPATGGLASRPSDRVDPLPVNDLLLVSEAPIGGGFEGRSSDERARLVIERGGSPASEQAVELGLAWLAAHQRQDGSWWLDHRGGPCGDRCANPGQEIETSIGATALAILPFLGAGYTHLQGKYQKNVSRGFEFLKKQMKVNNFGGDLSWDSTFGMYAHGISSVAFCEAYGMTGDQSLLPYAQPAIDYICAAHGPRGGWRYMRGEPGDTTVTGWQVMALKSARLSRLFVPAETIENAKGFLNTMQDGGGAFYGYMKPGKEPGPTAVGLLLRMYLGWSRQDDRIRRGVNYLAYLGPSSTDMYFNYYATQVMHHFEGEPWEQWNAVMRDALVHSQASSGHERGSWFFSDPHGTLGGRHYTTAICTMILQVYYRHMPLYGERAVDDRL